MRPADPLVYVLSVGADVRQVSRADFARTIAEFRARYGAEIAISGRAVLKSRLQASSATEAA